MERVVTIPIYETRKIEPYPSELGESKEYIVPKLERMINECSRFKQMLEEVELKLIEK